MAYFSRLIVLCLVSVFFSPVFAQTTTLKRAIVSFGGVAAQQKTFFTSWRDTSQFSDDQIRQELVNLANGQNLSLIPGYEVNYSSCVALANDNLIATGN